MHGKSKDQIDSEIADKEPDVHVFHLVVRLYSISKPEGRANAKATNVADSLRENKE